MARSPNEPRRKIGRPCKQRDEKHAAAVQAMAQYGVPQEDIAAYIGLSVTTMLKLYDTEYRNGVTIANAKVGEMLFKKCEQGDTACLIFWAKTRMGWREKGDDVKGGKKLALNLNFAPKRAGKG